MKQFLKYFRINRVELAQVLQTSKGYVYQIMGGKNTFSAGVREKLSINYPRLNIDWLMTGEGEMLLDKNQIKNELRILDPGTLDPLVMEDEPPGYGSPPADAPCPAAPGEGVMERLQRDVADSRTEVDRLWTAYRAMLADMERQLGAYNTLAQELGVVRARVLLLEQELERLGGGVVGDEVPPG